MWKIEIEESKKYAERGIVVMKDSLNGKKLFVRPREHEDGNRFLELIPLTPSELKELNIEESCANAEFFNIEIEESAGEPTATDEEVRLAMEREKKKLKFNMTDPEAMRKAKSVAEKMLAELEGKSNLTEEDKLKISEVKVENEDLRSKLEIVAELELSNKKKSLGLSPDDPMTGEQIRGYEKAVKDLKNQSSPAGNAPLNSFQMTGKGAEIGYESISEMLDAVRFKATFSQDPNEKAQNQAILDELLKRWARAKHENPSLQDKLPNDLTPQEYQRKKRKQRNAR